MKTKIKEIRTLFSLAVKEWWFKDPFRQSAIIAYYAIFSLPGLLFVVIAIAGYFFGQQEVNDRIYLSASDMMGSDTSEQIKEMVLKATRSKSTWLGSAIGILVMLAGATGVFVELQKTLNMIWKVEVVPQRGIIRLLKSRLFSFGLILAIAFLLLISFTVSTVLAAITNWFQQDASGLMVNFLKVSNFVISLTVISVLFGMIYKILPDAKIKWKHVWVGALVTGVLFTIGKTVLAVYFGKAQPGSIYGAAGSVIIILLWVSYSSMILFLGAELTAAYAKMYDEKVPPKDFAKVESPVTQKKVH